MLFKKKGLARKIFSNIKLKYITIQKYGSVWFFKKTTWNTWNESKV